MFKNFIKRIVRFLLTAIQSVITLYIKGNSENQTSDWKKLIGGLLPMIFSYLEAPTLDKVDNVLTGSEKFKKATEMVNKYLSKYVNIEVAQDDILAFIQHSYFKWLEDFSKGKDVTERVIMNDKEITIYEAI